MAVPLPEISDFILSLEDDFQELEPGALKPDSNLKDFVEWSSINALLLMTKLKEEFGISINVFELQNIEQVQDLYNLMVEKATPV